MTDLHLRPPITLAEIHRRWGWLLPSVTVLFVLLAIGAATNRLPWDETVNDWVLDNRSGWRDTIALRVSWFGSTFVVLTVSTIAAGLAARRCPSLAVAILVLALARPVSEFLLKELVDRPRPVDGRLVRGRGPSFPSGHPYAAAASWGVVPLVIALYTRRVSVWWWSMAAVWTLAVLVAASRVWLGVHWVSDVVAGLLLAILGVAVAERVIKNTHRDCRPPMRC